MTTNNSTTTTNNIDPPSSQTPTLTITTTLLQNELSSINRVSHKLAITPSTKLQKILSILLPKLLTKVGKLNTDMKEYKFCNVVLVMVVVVRSARVLILPQIIPVTAMVTALTAAKQ